MADLDELDRLHAAATAPHCDAKWVGVVRTNACAALHNAWPAISARLRAAEAVLRVIVACDDAINRGDEPPLSRAEVAAAARAALGEP